MPGEQVLERTFGASGEVVAEALADAEVSAGEETETEEVAEPDETGEIPAEGPAKIRIGSRTFATQAEALTYAQEIEREKIESDAYSKGLLDAQHAAAPAASVTQAAPEPEKFDEEKFYGNPQQFLAEYAQKIKDETLGTVEHKATLKRENDRIWSEFCAEHPELADFRSDVETCAAENLTQFRAAIALKGPVGGYNYVANKLKDKFAKQTEALKPRKKLPNVGGGASPGGTGASVTPKKDAPKILTFAEQVRLHRKGKR